MNKENVIKELENIKMAFNVWSNERIKKNIERLILEYKKANKKNNKKGKLITCVSNGQIILESETDGSLSVYEVIDL